MRRLLEFLGAEQELVNLRPRLPEGFRVYAVGDVHGQDVLLGELLELVERDNARRGKSKSLLVFLGDLIDRGPDSAKVLKRLRSYRPKGIQCVFLSGNHEEILLRILQGEDQLAADWLDYGGRECLASYGAKALAGRSQQGHAIGLLVRQTIPRADADFLRSFSDSFSAGDYLFVHAGIRPEIAIEDQDVHDLRWIREPFLDWHGQLPKMVVHGHTIDRKVTRQGSRIGIDTGAYLHGVLTAIGLEGEDQWLLQATTDGKH